MNPSVFKTFRTLPQQHLFNEFYAKDCSKKGRSVVRLKAETGARVSSRPRYGYMKDPADPKRHMVPDPGTAAVVRYIFDLCVSGKGPAQIAKQLKKDRIPRLTNCPYGVLGNDRVPFFKPGGYPGLSFCAAGGLSRLRRFRLQHFRL